MKSNDRYRGAWGYVTLTIKIASL